jgi:hypothetical protein
MSKAYDKFTIVPKTVKLKPFNFKERKDTKEITYGIIKNEDITNETIKTEIININTDNVEPINGKLNFYKKKI